MARIVPFKGILYNQDIVGDMADIATPPYDVISKEEQQAFYKRHPHNIIRLILSKTAKEDTDKDYHTKAAKLFNRWLSDKILVQDSIPAIYQTTVEFYVEDKKVIRSGMIALVGLEPFEKGIILPHERTFSRVKSERLDLIKKCHANFSSIFSLYSDSNSLIQNEMQKAVLNKAPDIDFVDDSGHRHKLWRVTDFTVHKYVTDAMKDKILFIADGHHRYETALSYKKWVLKNNPDFSADHPANYVMMYLCSMEDPGLTILPAHRIITGVEESLLSGLIQKCEKYFDVISIPIKDNLQKAIDKFIYKLKSNAFQSIIGACIKNSSSLYLLILKTGMMENMFGDELSKSLRNLDVTVLSRLILMEILKFSQAMLDDKEIFSYSSNETEAINRIISGKSDIAFILNPTTIEQVRRIAEEGLIMPRKSTYFYPKVITGQVINSLTTG